MKLSADHLIILANKNSIRVVSGETLTIEMSAGRGGAFVECNNRSVDDHCLLYLCGFDDEDSESCWVYRLEFEINRALTLRAALRSHIIRSSADILTSLQPIELSQGDHIEVRSPIDAIGYLHCRLGDNTETQILALNEKSLGQLSQSSS